MLLVLDQIKKDRKKIAEEKKVEDAVRKGAEQKYEFYKTTLADIQQTTLDIEKVWVNKIIFL